MSEYTLQTLRLDHVFDTRDSAVEWLDAYTWHRTGQPISLVYTILHPNNEEGRATLFAVGNDDGEGVNHGPDYYTIINESVNEIQWNEIEL